MNGFHHFITNYSSLILREQGQVSIHKLDSSLCSIRVALDSSLSTRVQVQIIQSHSWIFPGSPVDLIDLGDTCHSDWGAQKFTEVGYQDTSVALQ